MLGDLTYEYDKAGNRTNVGGSFARTGIPHGVASTDYNAANQQTTFGDKTLTYDDNGNLTSIVDGNGTTLYTWNARDQLTGISGPSVNATFVYDGVGRRQRKTIGENTTEFVYDRFNPVQEISGATVLANILTGLGIDEFLMRNDLVAGLSSHFLSDSLGTTIALVDSAGAVQMQYTYEPFGRTTVTGVSNSDPFQYSGRESDTTDVYYYRARYYFAGLQRFISQDPLGFSGGDVNLYAYVANNPIVYTDPLGLRGGTPGTLVQPTPHGKLLETMGYLLDELAADRSRWSDWNHRMDFLDEVNHKLNDPLRPTFECATWVLVCYRINLSQGYVKGSVLVHYNPPVFVPPGVRWFYFLGARIAVMPLEVKTSC